MPPRNVPDGSLAFLNWSYVALSADGASIFAAGWIPGDRKFAVPIFISTDAGGTWTSTDPFTGYWESLAASGDGTKLAAVSDEGSYWGVWTSTNSGMGWAAAPVTNGRDCVWSADGSTLVAAGTTLAASTNGGATWALFSPTNTTWWSAASSWDGTKLVAATYGPWDWDIMLGGSPGVIYVSKDSGCTWTMTSAPSNYWRGVASSADGFRLVAVASPSPYTPSIYSSADAGASWVSNSAPNLAWVSVASSADGCRLVAAESGGSIYTSQTIPKPVLSATRSGSDLLLSWTVPLMPFVLQQSANLSDPNWTDVSAQPVLNSACLQQQVIVHAPGRCRFYRLRNL